MTSWVVVLALVSCAKKSDAPAPPPDDRPKPTISEAEATRGRDACKAYVDKVCKCALDDAVKTIQARIADKGMPPTGVHKGSDIVVELPPVGSGDSAAELAKVLEAGHISATEKSPLAKICELSRALPDALRVSREVSLSPDSSAKDLALAEDSARKTIKECFEQLAKLPTVGCK